MKKAIVILIILILLAGTGFYFGWVQFQLSPNTYAVIFTKTSGWEEDVIPPGTFAWRIERLLPTNMTLLTFPLETKTLTIETKGELPSGEVYSTLMDNPSKFTYSFDIKITYTLDPNTLPTLAQKYHLTQDKTETLYEEINQQIEAVAHSTIYNLIRSSENTDISSLHTLLPKKLKETIIEENPSVNVLSAVPLHIQIPDYELYLHLKDQYFQLMETRHESLTEEVSKRSADELESNREFEELTRYGELLTEYPVLLKYLALKKDDKEILKELSGSPTEEDKDGGNEDSEGGTED